MTIFKAKSTYDKWSSLTTVLAPKAPASSKTSSLFFEEVDKSVRELEQMRQMLTNALRYQNKALPTPEPESCAEAPVSSVA